MVRSSPAPATDVKSTARVAWIVPALIGTSLFIQNLNSDITVIALPAMARSLGESPVRLNLTITLFLLANAVFMPLSSWIADRFGAKRVFMAAMVIFACSSAACGLAQNLPELLAARIFQGMTGAMMVPVGRVVLLRSIDRSQLVSAMAIQSMAGTLGPMLGPLVGGLIVTFANWRWVFLVNLPIAIPAVFLIHRFVPDVRSQAVSRLDLTGLLLTGISLACLIIGFDSLGHHTLPWWGTAALFGACIASSVVYTSYARGNPDAVLDLSLLRIPTYNASVIAGALVRMAIGALPFLLAIQLQVAFGMTPWLAGTLTFAGGAGNLLMRPCAPRILRTFGFRPVLLVNGAIVAATFIAVSLISSSTPAWLILAFLAVSGFFHALQLSSLLSLTFADVEQVRMGRAASMLGVSQQASQSIGVGLCALLLQLGMAVTEATHPTRASVSPAFLIIGAVTLLSLFNFAKLPKNVGADLTPTRGR